MGDAMMIVVCETEGCTTKVFGSGFCVTCELEQRKASRQSDRGRTLRLRLLRRPLRNRRLTTASR
jgi:hypothetical protein